MEGDLQSMEDGPHLMEDDSQPMDGDLQSMPEDFEPVASPEKHHVHHSYIWLGSARTFIRMFIIIVVMGASGVAGALSELGDVVVTGGRHGVDVFVIMVLVGGIAAVLLVILGAIILFTWLSYRYLWYEIGPEEFSLYSGILNKKRVHVPYARIQSVDQRATLLQRLFGVCSVSIDTAGGAANKAVIIPYVTKEQAEFLRNELYARKAHSVVGESELQPVAAAEKVSNVLDAPAHVWDDLGGVFAGDRVFQQAPTFEYGLSNRELIFAGLSNNTGIAGVLIIVFGLLAAVGQALDLADTLELDAYSTMEASVTSMMAGGQIVSFILGVIGFFVVLSIVIWLGSTVVACIQFGGFKARRRGSRIEVEQGLLQHRFQGIDIDRVQSVVVKQSFLRRLIGYCEISLGKVDALGAPADGNKNEQDVAGTVVIHPFVKTSSVREILDGIIPEYADVPAGGLAKGVRPAEVFVNSVGLNDVSASPEALAATQAEDSVQLEGAALPVAKKGLRRGIIRRAIWQGSGFWTAIIATLLWVLLVWLIDPVDGLITRDSIAEGTFSADDIAFQTVFLEGALIVRNVLYVVAAVAFVVDIVGAVLWWRHSSFGMNRRFMQVTNSGFATQSTYFERRKIQFGFAKTNPLQRRAHTATLNAVTAAGVGGTAVSLIDVTQDDADRWLTWLEPRTGAQRPAIS